MGQLCAKSNDHLTNKIVRLAKNKKYHSLGILLKDSLDKQYSLKKLKNLASQIDSQPLLDAIHATKRLYATHQKLSIKPSEFLQNALFILTELPTYCEKSCFLTSELTGLQDTIEYDPVTKKAFIHLDRYKNAWVGRGSKKWVLKSLLFDVKNPQIVARAEQIEPMTHELEICKIMRGARGVINMHAWTTHTTEQNTFTTLYLDLHKPGSIRYLLQHKEKSPFTPGEVSKIMYQLLTGLNSFHSKNLSHRDLHDGNCFISINKAKGSRKKIHAVIADLGRTLVLDQANGTKAQGAKMFSPPESWTVDQMEGNDYLTSDIYALGCVFYRLFFNTLAPWQGLYLKDKELTKEEKKTLLTMKLYDACVKRRNQLVKKNQKRALPLKQALELLILKMVHVNPAKRGSASSLREEAKAILLNGRASEKLHLLLGESAD